GELAAEVLVVLVACAEVGAEGLAEAGGQRGVGAGHVAAQVGFVLRGQAAAGLGAGGAVGVGADRMAGRVAGAGLVALGAELGAQGEGVVGVAADEATAEVEV